MADNKTVFQTEADHQQTRLDYYQTQFDKWVATPLKILWSDYRGKIGIILVVFYLLMGTVGPLLVRAPESGQGGILTGPFENWAFPLGTDGLGQGLLALMVHATPAMLKMMVAGAIFGNMLGVSIGLLAGYSGGRIDKVLMAITDTVASIPGIPLLLIFAAILEPRNPFVVGIVLNINGWAGGARGIRSQVLPLVEEEYVEAARAMGAPKSNIMVKEILPNLLPLIFIGFLGGATAVINASVGLYFLGVLPFTTQNWGVVLNYAYQKSGAIYSLQSAHWLVVPLVTIVGLTFGLTLLAQAFDQVFNPRVRARHEAPGRASEEPEEEEDTEIDAATAQTEMGGTI